MALVARLLLVAFAIGFVASQSHHFEMGARQRGDRQLHYEIVTKSSQPFKKVIKDIQYPAKGAVNTLKIGYVRAYDQYTNGQGGYVTLLNGGLNQTTITFHFKSQRGHGFNFILEIWGNM